MQGFKQKSDSLNFLYATALSNMAAINPTQLFKFKLIKIEQNFKLSFSVTIHISSAEKTHVSSGFINRKYRYRVFPPLQKDPSDNTVENIGHSMYGKHVSGNNCSVYKI